MRWKQDRQRLLAGVAGLLVAIPLAPASAQGLPDWAERAFGGRPSGPAAPSWTPSRRTDRGAFYDSARPAWRYDDERDWRRPPSSSPPRTALLQRGPELLEGGPQPQIAPVAPPIVAFAADYEANSIVIDISAKKLYFVLPGQQAYAYDISVGREGFSWTGTETVSRKQEWPDWHPPAEMRERDPKLPVKMTGGLRNPLGAMALYLGETLYRIHGTNDEKSIGRAESSGCFRMMNAAVLHLASITPIGTKVSVVESVKGVEVAGPAPVPPSRQPARARADESWRNDGGRRAGEPRWREDRWRSEERWPDYGRPYRPPPPDWPWPRRYYW